MDWGGCAAPAETLRIGEREREKERDSRGEERRAGLRWAEDQGRWAACLTALMGIVSVNLHLLNQ